MCAGARGRSRADHRMVQSMSAAGGRLRAYAELAKPRLSALAVFAVVAGCFLGWTPYGTPPLNVVVGTTVGTFLIEIGRAHV